MPRRASTDWAAVADSSRHLAVVVGCSAGGVQALRLLLSGLAQNLPVPVLVVCHTGSEDVDMLIDVLAAQSCLPVREATERQRPVPGTVHIAPAGYHLLIEADGRFALSVDRRVCFSRPSIDVLFESAAAHYQQALIGVVLTGANDDGALGLKTIRAHHGLAIVQSPDSAEAAIMPAAAIRIAGADHIVPLADIAALINDYCAP